MEVVTEVEEALPAPSEARRKTTRSEKGAGEKSSLDEENAFPAPKRARGRSSVVESEELHAVAKQTRGEAADEADGEARGRGQKRETKSGSVRPVSPSPERMSGISETAEASSSGSGLREMSVDEMNALRAKLGLKPLDTTSAPSNQPAADDAHLSTAERVRLAKERRMARERESKAKKQLENFGTLGDVSDEDDSAASWVDKHKRVLEEKKRAAIQAKQLEEVETEQSLAFESFEGMKVVHDADQLTEDTILVIKDANVLDQGDNDELESSEIVSIEKGKRYAEKMKKKSKYDLYDEDGNSKGILSQYDEEEEEKAAQKKKGFVLGSSTSKPISSSHSSSSKSHVASRPPSSSMEISEAQSDDLFSDTFTFGSRPSASSHDKTLPDDIEVGFAKKKVDGAGKSKKKLRQRKTEDEEESPLSVLDSLAPVSTSRLYTRSDRERIAEEEEDRIVAQRQRNFAKYQNALKSASDRSDAVFRQESLPSPYIPVLRSRAEDIVARTRALAAKREALDQQGSYDQSSDSGLVFSNLTEIYIPTEALVAGSEAPESKSQDSSSYYRSRHDAVKQEDQYGEAAMDIDESEREVALEIQKSGKTQNHSVASRDTSVTSSSIPSQHGGGFDSALDRENGMDVAEEEEEVAQIREASERLRKARSGKKRGGMLQEEELEPTTEVAVKKEDVEAEALFLPSDTGITKSHRVHQGLGSMLALLQSKGVVEDTGLMAGREKDRKLEERMTHGSNTQGVPEYYREIEIERKDKWGRDMTAKEAFKQFSSAFSGNQSGKRKQEKKYQKFKEQIRHQQQLTDSSVAASLSSVYSAQKRSAAPFVVLSSQSILSRPSSHQQDRELGDTLKAPSSSSGSSSVKPK
jgi:U4/U6.U5 tri-snRNP-associated protein 1